MDYRFHDNGIFNAISRCGIEKEEYYGFSYTQGVFHVVHYH